MIRVHGRFFIRCRLCDRLERITIDTGFIDYDSITHRSMGPEYYYSFEERFDCECGNPFFISLKATEYPVGTIETVHYQLNGEVEASNNPQIEAIYAPEEEWNADDNYGFRSDPRVIIQRMNDRQFELFAASVLYEMGYQDVRVTKKTRDGGFDFEAVDTRFGVNNYIIGECKHFGENHKVDEDIIRKAHDVQYEKHANTAMVITSSSFTIVARKRAADYRMTLWDINDLIRFGGHLLEDYC